MGMLGLSKITESKEAKATAECDDENDEELDEAPSYSVADDHIQIEQSSRLVSRAMKMNKFK